MMQRKRQSRRGRLSLSQLPASLQLLIKSAPPSARASLRSKSVTSPSGTSVPSTLRSRKRRSPAPTKTRKSRKSTKRPKLPSIPGEQLKNALLAAGISGWIEEHKFHPLRRWKFDFSFPERRIAVEVEGGIWTRGRHVRPQGYINDCEKYTVAALNEWMVLRFPVVDGWLDGAIEHIRQALSLRGVR